MKPPTTFQDLSPATSARLLTLVSEIQARLAPICVETPAPVFDEMVLRIANVQLAFERDPSRTSPLWPTRPASLA